MNDGSKFRIVLQTNKFVILVEPYYILEQGCFINIDKAEKIFKNKYPNDCFWDFIDEIKKQDCIQEVSIDGDIIITKDFSNLIQCTGLKDKNGKLIYEGDIVKFNFDTDEIRAVVSWDDKELIGFYLNTTDYFKDKYVTDYDFYKNDYEVIGNIYENPELLEE